MRDVRASTAEISDWLLELPLFSELRRPTARALAADCRLRRLDKGNVLFYESDAPDSAYVVRSGRIALVLNSPDGRELVIDDARPGDVLGELGPLTQQPRSATAVARTGAEVLAIPRHAFLRVLDDEPCVVRALLDITASRLQKSAVREMALAFLDAQARLARYLLELEEEERDKGYVTVSQEELARGTGLTRQTVAKALGGWRRQGWLLTGRGRIVILKRGALEALRSGSVDLALVSPG
jgi:CRP/FNR family cyclic AMP-dependent transcriptional regulator